MCAAQSLAQKESGALKIFSLRVLGTSHGDSSYNLNISALKEIIKLKCQEVSSYPTIFETGEFGTQCRLG